MKSLIIIPAFNEAGRIGRVVAGVRKAVPDVPVLVVDDGSSDDTVAVARRAGARVVALPFNLGAGGRRPDRLQARRRRGLRLVAQLDGDGQHEPADLPALLGVIARGEADVAIGSRFPGRRRLLARVRPRRIQGMGLSDCWPGW